MIIVNPLPISLRHYCLELLTIAGPIVSEIDESVSIEAGPRSHKVLATMVQRVKYRFGTATPVMIVWPTYGFLDLPSWLGRKNTFLVFHDPEPLQTQVGLGKRAARLARVFPSRPTLIAHSAVAQSSLASVYLQPDTVLPHPMLPPRETTPTERRIGVFGRFKAARNTHLLESIAGPLRDDGYQLVIVGSGWPAVRGWQVSREFLSEESLQSEIERCQIILVPYDRVFQSGIAVRAAESGVRVVGPAQSNIEDLFGTGWPGLVSDPHSHLQWIQSIRAVDGVTDGVVDARLAAAHTETVEAWTAWLRATSAI